jgi:hypothetical protein
LNNPNEQKQKRKETSMEIILCIVTGCIGAVVGYVAGRVIGEMKQPPLRDLGPSRNQTKLMKQYQNFLSYDGTDRGQKSIEN